MAKNLIEDAMQPAGGKRKILNRHFSEWNELILVSATHIDSSTTASEDYYNLLYECAHHANKNSKELQSKNIVAFVHPLYASIQGMLPKTPFDEIAFKAYNKNLTSILKAKEHFDADFLLIDTEYHYAYSTSKLLEEGFFDAAAISHHNSGILFLDDLNKLQGKNVYFAGGYNNRCLCETISQLVSSQDKANVASEIKQQPYSQIYALNDVIINHPNDSFGFAPHGIIYYKERGTKVIMAPQNVLSKKEFVELAGKDDMKSTIYFRNFFK